MRKGILMSMVVWGMALMVGVPSVHAGEVDLLIQKLVEKGVLSAGEGQELLVETKEEVKKQNAKGTNEAIPAWVQTVKVKGDFRMRYEGNDQKGDSDSNRHRARMRVRLGVEAKPNDQMKVGVGIATGTTSNARSTNQTLPDETASTPGSFKNIILDYGYGQYMPFNWMTVTAGKFKNPIWQTTDMLFDTDTNPDGGALQLQTTLTPGFDVFLNSLIYALGETAADQSDPFMVAAQPGFSWSITDKLTLKSAFAYYAFNSVKGATKFTNSKASNTGTTKYTYDYDSINPSVELGLKEPLGGLVPYAAVFGDYVKNVSPDVLKKDGWTAGVKFGSEKVSGWGDWQLKGMYTRLAKDAFIDYFPDSDRFGGRTGMKSYEGILEFGLTKNSTLGLDYYYSQKILPLALGTSLTKLTRQPESVVQVDWVLKF